MFLPSFSFAEELPNYRGMPGHSRMKALGDAWSALDDTGKAPFYAKAELDRQRVAVEKEGLVAPGSVDWQNFSTIERQDLLHELRTRKDVVALAQGVSRKLALSSLS